MSLDKQYPKTFKLFYNTFAEHLYNCSISAIKTGNGSKVFTFDSCYLDERDNEPPQTIKINLTASYRGFDVGFKVTAIGQYDAKTFTIKQSQKINMLDIASKAFNIACQDI